MPLDPLGVQKFDDDIAVEIAHITCAAAVLVRALTGSPW